MHKHYIYYKYFVNKLTTIFSYQNSFINNNIVNKIKCIFDLITLFVLIFVQRKKIFSACTNFRTTAICFFRVY